MKIRGQLVDNLIEIDKYKYEPFACHIDKGNIFRAKLTKMLNGLLKSSPTCYKKFANDINEICYKANPHEMCVDNKIMNQK